MDYSCVSAITPIILPVVLYGCKAWSLALREKRRLRVFENRILRRIFGPKGSTMRNFIVCAVRLFVFILIKSRRLRCRSCNGKRYTEILKVHLQKETFREA